MKAVHIHGIDDVRVDEIDEPTVGPKDVLLRVDACGICGSDLTFAKYGFQLGGSEPWPLGHEAAGTIIAIGDAVTDFAVGMRVAVNPMGTPGNVIGNGGTEGAFADYLLIRDPRPGQHLFLLPDDMSAERAALVEPLAVALHGINQAALKPEDKVVVYGAGPIGLGAVFWLKRRGIRDIASVDLSDARLGHARELGAHHVINPGTDDLKQALIAIHGEDPPMFGSATVGTDIFLDMAGAPALLEQTIAFAKFQARIVLTAVYPMPVTLDLQGLLIREISIIPAVGYPSELPEVLATVANTRADLDPYVSKRFAFRDFHDAFAAAKDRDSAKVMVLFD